MPLEEFFEKGNALCIFGSTVYCPRPELAPDLDFTIFTHNGRNLFRCSPQYEPEICDFLKARFPDANRFDFTGRGDYRNKPYNIDRLPKNDPALCGYFLTGRFFPSSNFLEQHYRKAFGKDYMLAVWLCLVDDVANFEYRGIRIGKRQKDLLLLLRATASLADGKYPGLSRLTAKYKRRFGTGQRRSFCDNPNLLVQGFISDAKKALDLSCCTSKLSLDKHI